MQKVVGFIRGALDRYNMISEGDVVAVGVSGGKDSLILLAGLHKLRSFYPVSFDIVAVTIDPCFNGIQTDYSPVERMCEELQIKYVVKRTDIGPVVFDTRRENNPCSLCARMRRGVLHDTAKEHGCNKLALGHNLDDAVETFMMNLFNEGRLGCFSPVTYMSRKDITVIRPLVYMPESDVRNAALRLKLPIVKSRCPVDGHTARESTKQYIAEMEKRDPGLKMRLFGAMTRAALSGWKEFKG